MQTSSCNLFIKIYHLTNNNTSALKIDKNKEPHYCFSSSLLVAKRRSINVPRG